ncbi:wax ester/triacylglycerol synthase domain-containing protein [Rhodococcus sp. (in: high G+C Gram-positive bacteria)]|uniref:wax ester/triacylglycerol synthase domain-containing protein n=1 Tax=Rhodococcus sp. TaxID=1831 RepID=UPI00257FCFF0|nr:wax ester/triacylglycerol synthase domain-containing protein [Rhodococcus sp. (in: high G+C Gram-positive bacteria)]MBQ7803965.1 DUF1298 domain-containing protein [Rhodococcus sp. (in: high G+C Gram-positive bacteria)]
MDARDAAFFYLERQHVTQSFVTGYVFFSDDGGAPDVGREEIVGWLSDRVDGLPALRDRVIRVPFALAVPRVCEDANFDIGRHLVFHDAAHWDDLRTLAPQLIARRMDPAHPLWRIHVAQKVRGVMGRSDPATVVMIQFHHSIADGQESVRIAKRLFSSAPVHVKDLPSLRGGAVPSIAGLTFRSLVSVPWVLMRFLSSLRTIGAGNRLVRDEVARGDYRVEAREPFAAPFNGALGERRRFDCLFIPFGEVKKVRSALGNVTINDIFLAIVSLGLSRYLAERGSGSSGSLGATVPVSTRGIAPAQTSRNQFVVCGVDLHTDVADPIERVHRIHNSAVEAISAAKSPGHMMIFGALASVPGFIFKKSVGVIERRQHRNPVASFHTGISSVPRGEGDWRLGDAKAVGCFDMISLEGIAGVGHTIDTLGDLATINITVDPDLFADIDRYRELLADAWNDIRTSSAALEMNSVAPSQ